MGAALPALVSGDSFFGTCVVGRFVGNGFTAFVCFAAALPFVLFGTLRVGVDGLFFASFPMGDFFATGFLPATFLVAAFLGAVFLGAAFFGAAFLVTVFLALTLGCPFVFTAAALDAAFFVAGFLAVACLATAFFKVAFLGATFLPTALLAPFLTAVFTDLAAGLPPPVLLLAACLACLAGPLAGRVFNFAMWRWVVQLVCGER